MKVLSGLIVTLSFALFIAGCKKDDPTTPQSTCKITSIVSDNISIAIAYNTNGTVSSVTDGPNVRSYSYNGNTITQSITNSGQASGKVIVTVNGAGLATNVRSESPDGTNWANEAYEYDGNQASKVTYTSSNGGSAEITTFQWLDGNLASITQDGDVQSLTYYTDRPSQPGDYFSVLYSIEEGYEVFRNKNMLKSATDGTNTNTITYTFDSDGKVTSLTADLGNSTIAYGLSYKCN